MKIFARIYCSQPKARVILFLFPLIFLIVGIEIARAAVDLMSYTATPINGAILIEWETATEFDNAGFFLMRSLSENGGFVYISPFIPAEGGGVTGALYEFTDEDVLPGVTYYYLLEAIGLNQQSEYYGPISAALPVPTNTPTRTSTATNSPTSTRTATSTATGSTPTTTRTPTQTRTATGPTPTRTKTPARTSTPIPTRTFRPIQSSSTPTPTSTSSTTPTFTLTATGTISETTTPTITINLLPTQSSTADSVILSPPTITPTPSTTPPQPPDRLSQSFTNLVASGNFVRISLVLLTTILWGILSLGLYLYRSYR